MRMRKAVLGALSSLLLVMLPTVSDAVTFTCGTAAPQSGAGLSGAGSVAFDNLDCGNGFRATGRVDALDSPTLSQLILTGTLTNTGPLAGQLAVTFASSFGDFATKPIDTYLFNLNALGFFSDAFGTTDATGDSFVIAGNARNNTPTGPLVFIGTVATNAFDTSSTASGGCGFADPVEPSPCRPSLSVTSNWTLEAGHSVDLPISLAHSVPEPTTVALLIPGLAGLVLSWRAGLLKRGR